MTCTGTCGSGCRTVGTRVTGERRRMERRGSVGTVPCASCAAAPWSATPGPCAPRTASGTPPAGPSASASGWPGPLLLEFFYVSNVHSKDRSLHWDPLTDRAPLRSGSGDFPAGKLSMKCRRTGWRTTAECFNEVTFPNLLSTPVGRSIYFDQLVGPDLDSEKRPSRGRQSSLSFPLSWRGCEEFLSVAFW